VAKAGWFKRRLPMDEPVWRLHCIERMQPIFKGRCLRRREVNSSLSPDSLDSQILSNYQFSYPTPYSWVSRKIKYKSLIIYTIYIIRVYPYFFIKRDTPPWELRNKENRRIIRIDLSAMIYRANAPGQTEICDLECGNRSVNICCCRLSTASSMIQGWLIHCRLKPTYSMECNIA
jgi:hypothetical protein